MQTKYCKYCKTIKAVSEFCKHPSTKDKLSNKCRECQSKYNKRRNSTIEGREAQRNRVSKWLSNPQNAKKASNRSVQWKKDNSDRVKERYLQYIGRTTLEQLDSIVKLCNTCNVDKLLKEFSPGGGKYGRSCTCKSCASANRMLYRKSNPEKFRKYDKEQYKKRKEYYREYSKVYRLLNWDRLIQKNNQWRRDNQKNTEYGQKRRALTLKAFIEPVDWRALKKAYGNKCVYCGTLDRLTLDHVIPLTKGGWHGYDNVVPACLSCNAKKGNKNLEELGWPRPKILTKYDL